MNVQLELFTDNTPKEIEKSEIEILRDQLGNVRRGLFARHNELAKFFMQQQIEIDELKKEIRSLHEKR
jgi:hypothetical protein